MIPPQRAGYLLVLYNRSPMYKKVIFCKILRWDIKANLKPLNFHNSFPFYPFSLQHHTQLHNHLFVN
ncbi:hypothetical protein Hanom_Chr01g00050631 [Helianthus anomalus]